MKRSLFLLAAFLFLYGSVNPSSGLKIKKDITISADQTYSQDIVAFGGNIEINGTLEGSIILIGGGLKINGNVKKDIICFSAQVTTGEKAIIDRDMIIIGGKLAKHNDTSVKGEFFYNRFDLKRIESTFLPIISDSRTVTFLKAIKIILWFIIALIIFSVFPKRVVDATDLLENNLVKAGFIGFSSILVFIFFIFIFTILSFFIIGIPFLLCLLIFYFIIYMFGRTVIFYFIGRKLVERLKSQKISGVVYILIGVLLYSFLKFLPYLGIVFLIIMNVFEVGIGIFFLLKKRIGFKGKESVA